MLFSYNNYKEPLNSRSQATINKQACVIHDQQDDDKSQSETDFGASDVRFLNGDFIEHFVRLNKNAV